MDVNHFGFQPGTIFSECAQKEEEGGRERGREGERTSLCGGRHAPPAAAPAEWSPAQSRRRKEKKNPQQQQQKKRSRSLGSSPVGSRSLVPHMAPLPRLQEGEQKPEPRACLTRVSPLVFLE